MSLLLSGHLTSVPFLTSMYHPYSHPIATFWPHTPTITLPPSQLISGHLEEAASELDEIPRLHVLPTEGREYLEGLEVRGGGGEVRG